MKRDRKQSPYIANLKESLDGHIGAAVAEIESPGLREAAEYAVRGGKRIRPLITVLACAAAGGRESDAFDAGVAVELLHTASLLHDDIMDRSELRRGRQTLHTKFDTARAILAGDALIALAFRRLQRLAGPKKDAVLQLFTTAFLRLCEGQNDDLTLGETDAVDSEDHRAMVEKKTAMLMEAAAGIGAFLGSDKEHPSRCLRCFGFNIGMAFQAMDDLLDVTGDEVLAGKTLGLDARNGKKTFVTLPSPGHAGSTGVVWTVAEHTRSACDALSDLSPTPARDCLMALAQDLMAREG